MLPKGTMVVGDFYSHDSWEKYWEGTLKRDNANIGELTTQTNTWLLNYGLTDRLTVMTTIPRVWTHASQGVLHEMAGFQDMTLAAKYSVWERRGTRMGSLRAIAAVAGAFPLTDYTPDFYPLSIGSASRRVSGRVTLGAQSAGGWFVSGSTAYTWRASVKLDRPYYFTDGRLFLTDTVDMPNVFDYVATAGYGQRAWMTSASFSQQRTLGGGDIRRHDMPFVSNRMNFSKVGGMVMAGVPKIESLSAVFAYNYTIAGRNVGQAQTFTAGLLYRLPFNTRTVR
ncbi:MAG TPA: transporter [Vicinamibacterales bacterium]|nr:transporter [Vicinamibacterales bacterium]